MEDVTTNDGHVYNAPEGNQPTTSVPEELEGTQPVNGWIQIKKVEEESILKTNIEDYAPQVVTVKAISYPWYENGVQLVASVELGDKIICLRIFTYNLNGTEVHFVKDSDIVTLL